MSVESPIKQFGNGLKLGRTPSPKDAVQLHFSSYLDLEKLPTPPADFGHQAMVKAWPMLMNDQLGDCVIAGSLHQIQLYNLEAGITVPVSDDAALKNYERIGHYVDGDPSTDGGCDMAYAAQIWRNHGITDASGVAHKIAAYVAMHPGKIGALKTATWLFSAVGVGIEFPNFAMDYFTEGKAWDLPTAGDDTTIEGGHYIPLVGFLNGNFLAVTWGQLIQVTPAFLEKYTEEVIIHFSTEMLTKGESLEGFDTMALAGDLRSVTHLA